MPAETRMSELQFSLGPKQVRNKNPSSPTKKIAKTVQIVEDRDDLIATRTSSIGRNLKKTGSRFMAANKGATQKVGKGLGVAGKGTARGARFVGKGVGVASKETVKVR
jgi:ribosomal protein L18